MQMKVYEDFIVSVCKDPQAVVDQFDAEKAHLMHMTMGISGEAGELLDAVKKAVIYNKELDKANVIEELGDLMFYITNLCLFLGTTVENCMEANMEKLQKRYNRGTYSDAQAIERSDKS